MKQTQLKYAIARIESIAHNKKEGLRELYSGVQPFSDTDRERLIKNKEVVFKAPSDPTRYTKYFDCYDFSEHKKRTDDAFVNETRAYEDRCKAVDKCKREVIDHLVLGDEEEALSQLQTFSQMEF